MKNYLSLFAKSFDGFQGDFPGLQGFLAEAKPQRLLDVGAGFGRTLAAYKGVPEIILADRSAEMCAMAAERVVSLGIPAEVVRCEAYHLPFPDAAFDAVVLAFAALSEMEPLPFTLGEVARVLRPGGHLYSLMLNPVGFRTGSIGLDRAVKSKWAFPLSTETIPVQGKGTFQYEVQLVIREEGHLEKFLVEQSHPDLESMKKMFASAGLSVREVYGDFNVGPLTDASPLIQLRAVRSMEPAAGNDNAASCSAHYDKIAPKYDEISSADTYFVPAWLSRQLEPYKGYKPAILDLGCASGNLASLLARTGVVPSVLFGADVSMEMVRLARAKAYTAAIQADLSLGFPVFRENIFDITVASGCLEFIEDPSLLLRDAYRAAGPGALLFCTFEHGADFFAEMLIEGRRFRRYQRSEATVRALLGAAGWRAEEVSPGPAYTSPTSGASVNYLFCRARKVL